MGTSPRQPRELSLFSGIGGGVLGSKLLGWRTVCYVERDEFCQRVLKRRIADGWLDDAPIWDDVRTFNGRPWRGRVDVLTAGFPCQPFSVAGKRRAGKDPRDMWPDTARAIREVRPPVCLLENTPGLARGSHGYFGRVLGDLAECGYDACWDIIPAAAACAPHRRERVWILAWRPDAEIIRCGSWRAGRPISERSRVRNATGTLANSEQVRPRGREGGSRGNITDGQDARRQEGASRAEHDGTKGRAGGVAGASGGEKVGDPDAKRRDGRPRQQWAGGRRQSANAGREASDADRTRPQGHGRPVDGTGERAACAQSVERQARRAGRKAGWLPEPDVGRLADGISDRVDRLKSLGNAQVPHQMALAWTLLSRRMHRLLGEADGGEE